MIPEIIVSIIIINYDKNQVEESHTGVRSSPNRSWGDESGVWEAICNCRCLYVSSHPHVALLISEEGMRVKQNSRIHLALFEHSVHSESLLYLELGAGAGFTKPGDAMEVVGGNGLVLLLDKAEGWEAKASLLTVSVLQHGGEQILRAPFEKTYISSMLFTLCKLCKNRA